MSEAAGGLFIVSGPSGVGKSTLVQRLLRNHPGLKFSVSYTTRTRRPGEQDGVHYHFISRETFHKMVIQGAFLEHAEYNGNRYGTPLVPIRQWVAQGRCVILEIEVQGARQLKDQQTTLGFPMHFIFILPPSKEQLDARIQRRGTEDEAKRLSRLKIAEEELRQARWFDVRIVNENLEDAFTQLERAIGADCDQQNQWK